MLYSSMQWKHVHVAAALALLLIAPLQARAADEGSFFDALERYGADDFSGCARLLDDLLQRGGHFPEGASCCWSNVRRQPATVEVRWTI